MNPAEKLKNPGECYIVAALAILLLLWGNTPGSSAAAGQPAGSKVSQADLSQVWEQAQTAGSYRFTADIEQTMRPQPITALIGETSQRADLRVEGEVALPDQAHLRLFSEGDTATSAPILLVQNGNQTFAQVDGQLQQIENPMSTAVPGGNYLSYLAVADNVRQLEGVTANGERFTRYAFTINGQQLAAHLARQMAADLPPGQSPVASPLVAALNGQGELWVDAHNLPRRQILDLEIIGASAGYDSVSHTVVNFYDFGNADSLAQPAQDKSSGAWVLQSATTATTATTRWGLIASQTARPIASLAAVLLLIALLLVVAVRQYIRRPRLAYAVVAITITLLMLFSPLLQVAGYSYTAIHQAEAAPPTLGEAMGWTETAETTAATSEQTLLPPSQNGGMAQPTAICGDGTPGLDSDSDTLSDITENCLGTDPLSPDTDRDRVPDGMEVAGFEFDGRTWPGDPFRADSNNDGLLDNQEWIVDPSQEYGYEGQATEWDSDTDGVPNPWDDDNDGDGVPDALDIAPYARTQAQETFDFSLNGNAANSIQYIDIQVRPVDEEHLRFTTTGLDWPNGDTEGTIQDWNNGRNDLRLTPMLLVQANVAPEEELARQYGVAVDDNIVEILSGELLTTTQVNANYPYLLLVPLSPVTDGGQIVGFQTHLAYGANGGDVRWQMQMAWVVEAEQDGFDDSGYWRYGRIPVAQYRGESFALTGLQVTQNTGYESAIFAISPDASGNPANTDQQLYQMLFGLNAAFLNALQPEPEPNRPNEATALAEIQYRFDRPNMDTVYRWGLDEVIATDRQTFSHRDAALASTLSSSGRVNTFLNHHFPSSNQATLVYANEETSGSFSLDEMTRLSSSSTPAMRDSTQLAVNLNSQITLVTRRALSLELFNRRGATWSGREFEDSIVDVHNRYADVSATLAALGGESPDLTADEVRGVVILFYASWYFDHVALVQVGPHTILPPSRPNEEIFGAIEGNGDLPTYLITSSHLNEAGGGLKISAANSRNWGYAHNSADLMNTYLGLILEGSEEALAESAAPVGGGFVEISSGTIRIATQLKNTISVAAKAYNAYDMYQLAQTGATLRQFFHLQSAATSPWWKHMTNWKTQKLGVAALAVQIGVTWALFALTTDFSNPLAIKAAVTYAIVSTAIAIALFVLSLNPIGAVFVAVLGLIDAIVFFITGTGAMERITRGIAQFFYDYNLLSKLESINFSGSHSAVIAAANGNQGMITGSTLVIRDRFVGYISGSDRRHSSVYGRYLAESADAIAANQNQVTQHDQNHCVEDDGLRRCESLVGAAFQFTQAGPNQQLSLTAEIHSKLRYEECDLIGICVTYNDYDNFSLPDHQADAEPMYLDVLPATVDELWNWELTSGPYSGHHFNPLANAPVVISLINTSDSDSDGLSDRDERYYSDNNQWVGGWEVALAGGGTTRLFADPAQADADGDGLSDLAERTGGSSPFAYNDAPRLVLTATPAITDTNGRRGVYVQAGNTVQLRLDLVSSGPRAINTILQLCLPSSLTNVSGGTLSGSRTPATQNGTCTDGTAYIWDFAGSNTLLVGEAISTIFTATVDSGLSQSAVLPVTANLPYDDGDPAESETAIQTLLVYVDLDNPTIAFDSPADGDIIGGGISSYVLGGPATDPTSWVTEVSLDLPGLSVGASLGTASETGRWAYTWQLPQDGVYSLSAEAYDYFAHAGSTTIQVTVDNTPPVATINTPANNTIVSGNGDDVITIPISGSSSDNLSGVRLVQISINDRPWRTIATGAGGWNYDWRLSNDVSVQGEHNLRVRAFDVANNISTVTSQTVIVDIVPPTSGLSDNTFIVSFPSYPTGQPVTLDGVANDAGNAPLPASPVELNGTLDSLADATIWLEPAALSDRTDNLSATWVGDFNGDRLADLAIGLPAAAEGAGTVTIVYGQAGGWPIPPNAQALATSRTSFTGLAGAGLGEMIAAAGDVNGDGLDDLLVGDPANNLVYLVLGRLAAYGQNQPLSATCDACRLLTLPAGTTLVGLGAAGDVNNDGLSDILINTDNGNPQAHLLLGQSVLDATADAVLIAAVVIDLASASTPAIGLGDRNGDQYGDFAAWTASGQLTVWHGDELTTGLKLDGSTLNPQTISSNAPYLAALGDSNGDALADFAYSTGSGVTVVYGATNGSTSSTAAISLPSTLSFLAGVGNVTGGNEADILAGAGGDAFLYTGDSLGTPAATLTGVSKAAAAPYSAGADLNADGSADLLIVPDDSNATGLGFGEPPAVDQNALPTATTGSQPGATTLITSTLLATAGRHVDDDGLCQGYTPCYPTIQAAVNAATAGQTIAIHAGVYQGATINGKNNLALRGVNPDAVFVQGGSSPFAFKIMNATGVILSDMTISGAANAIELESAGIGGYSTTTNRITLERLLIHGFTSHALQLDRLSTADFRRSTIVGSGSGAYLYVNTNQTPDPLFVASWSSATPSLTPGNGTGGALLDAGNGTLYDVRGNSSQSIASFAPGGSSTTINAPQPVGPGSVATADRSGDLWLLTHAADNAGPNGPVFAIAYRNDNEIYIGGNFTQAGGVALNPPHIARWDGQKWNSVGGSFPVSLVTQVTALEWDFTGNRLLVGVGVSNIGFGFPGANLLSWNGSTWTDLAVFLPEAYPTLRAAIYAIEPTASRIYVGGEFYSLIPNSSATAIYANSITYLNRSTGTWNALDGKPNDDGNEERGGGVWQVASASGTRPDCGSSGAGDADCRVAGSVYALDANYLDRLDTPGSTMIYIGGQFAFVGGNTDHAADDRANGIVAFDEMAATCNFQTSPPRRDCWRTFARDSFNITGADRRDTPHARGVGPQYRTNPSPLPYISISSGTVRSIEAHVYSIDSVELYLGGQFDAYDWAGDTDNDKNVDDNELTLAYRNIMWVVQSKTANPSYEYDETWNCNGWGPYLTLDGTIYTVAWGGGALLIMGGDFTGHMMRDNSNCTYSPISSPDIPNNTVYTFEAPATIGHMYVGGAFDSPGTTSTAHVGVYRYLSDQSAWGWSRELDKRFYHYDGASWTQRSLPPIAFGDYARAGTLFFSDENATTPSLYAIAGGRVSLYSYTPGTDTWANVNRPTTTNMGSGAATLVLSNTMYLLPGGQTSLLYRRVGTGSWERLTDSPNAIDTGAAMSWDGGNYIYVAPGGGKRFSRYSLSTNSWETIGDGNSSTLADADLPVNSGLGSGLARVGNTLYYVPGGGVAGFYRFGPVNTSPPNKLSLDCLVYVASAATPAWTNVTPAVPLPDFRVMDSGNSVWVGSGWSPAAGNTAINLATAAFLDPASALYRPTATTPFATTAGYRPYAADTTVAPNGCAGSCYSSIQAAINSGAGRITVQPGSYNEAIYLANGVTLVSGGADTTVLVAPSGIISGSLVSAEGVRNASLTGFTLNGSGQLGGLRVEDGATGITFARSLIRQTRTAVQVRGSATQLNLLNNTIVDNTAGILATACAALALRNNIIAYQDAAGLDVASGCSATNQYNLYWANTPNQGTNTTTGPGELFLNPQFADQAAGNYHLKESSPAVNTGDPGDPAPPGSGRVDIGYQEQGQASFYVSATYCATCLNDGLAWGINAFSTIQPALDAAGNQVRLLAAALSDPHYTVAVAPGRYNGNITLPSYIRLVGSGTEQTILDAQDSGSTVTFNGVVDASISGFTIRGAAATGANVLVTNAANQITISHNLIRNSSTGGTGIRFNNRASGLVTFNTITANGTGVASQGARTWAEVTNNIIAGNQYGLESQDGVIGHGYNLLFNTTDYRNLNTNSYYNVTQVDSEIVGVDPLLSNDNFSRPSAVSPALNAADPAAPVPVGGGNRADLGYFEWRALPLSLFLGDQGLSKAVANSGIASVQLAVVPVTDPTSPLTATLPADSDWQNVTLAAAGDTVSSWQASYTPAADGLYRVYSRAADDVNNVESDPLRWYNGSFLADGTAPTIAWQTTPASGNAPLELRVLVSDTVAGRFNVASVYFEVNGSRVNATWLPQADESNGRLYRAWAAAANGAVTVQAFATDYAGNSNQTTASSITVSGQQAADTTAPTLVVTAPADGALGSKLITFSGTATDSGSGLASVAVSLDGGYSWQPAVVSGNNWQWAWQTADSIEGVSYPVQVRATDNAGNQTSNSRTLTVDNRPAQILDLAFSPQAGEFTLSDSAPLTVSWASIVDGSGPADLFMVIDQQPETATFDANANRVTTNPFTTNLQPGTWYAHVTTRDAAGNTLLSHYGPWYVAQHLDDGFLDLSNGEWLTLAERMDDDERGYKKQELYTTWDADHFYIGWQGAHWQIDGTMWVYVGSGTAGSTTTVDGGRSLPFAANYAVSVDGPDAGELYTYNGNWQAGSLDFTQGESGGTEVVLPFGTNTTNAVSLIAFAVNDAGQVWSIFPTTNPVDPAVNGSSAIALAKGLNAWLNIQSQESLPMWTDGYNWSDLANAVPNANQPTALNVGLNLTSQQAGTAAWGPNNLLVYEVQVTNGEDETLTGLQLSLTGSDGLSYPGGNNVTLADLAPHASRVISFTGQLATDLSGLTAVSTTVSLQQLDVPLAAAAYSHQVDGQPPTVTLFTNPAQALGVGQQTLTGSASDGSGAGVAHVEISTDGANWQSATGTAEWSAAINVSGGTTINVQVRAVDLFGNTSEAASYTLNVDSVAPQLSFNLPPAAYTAFTTINGTTVDLSPEGSQVVRVEIQVDGESNPWLAVSGPFAPANGTQPWSFTWEAPIEDGVTHQLRARATDVAGNVSEPTAWQTIVVDRVAPTLSATSVLTGFMMAGYLAANVTPATPPIASGTAGDGNGLPTVVAQLVSPAGNTITATLVLADGGWSYLPTLPSPSFGDYTLSLAATDTAGNRTEIGPFTLSALNSPPVCTSAAPSSALLWPPNQQFSPIQVNGITDPDGQPTTVTINTIFQDEPVSGTRAGNTTPDGQGLGTGTAEVRVERNTPGNGRVYHISFTADDGNGGSCSGQVNVTVSANQNQPAVDDGALHDSTQAGGSSLSGTAFGGSVPLAGLAVVIITILLAGLLAWKQPWRRWRYRRPSR